MKIAVIGAGPSGMMAALTSAQEGAEVTLFEKNEKTGKKLYISGKGRCNFTNDCSANEFLQNVVSNAKFMQGAIRRFSPSDAINFCQSNGLAMKVERGNRVFPQSDKSSDVIKTFNKVLSQAGVEARLNCPVLSVSKQENFVLQTEKGNEQFDKVIVATGGYSYRATGCDGFGYEVAKSFGHTLVPLRAALCRILCSGTKALEGLSLRNVQVSFVLNGKTVASEFGEMLFTNDGVSGPCALTLSSLINSVSTKGGKIKIDLKPALDEQTLDARILRDFQQNSNKNFGNALGGLLPERLIEEVVRQSGVSFSKKVHQVTAEERARLVATLKGLSFDCNGLDDVNFGIVTAGGVCVKEVSPSTMQSKLVEGLYFCGEVLDLDAFTGGFNIQIALSTGFVAGLSASKS